MALPLAGGCPAFVFANAGGRGYYVPDYGDDLLRKLAANRDALTAAEFESVLLDQKALLRGGAVTSAEVVHWIRLGAAARDRHVVQAAAELAEYTGNALVAENERPRYAEFIRQVFGPRAKALGFVPKAGESDDDQLLRRAILRVTAPEDPALAKEARRLSLAWLKNRGAVDPGLVDVVLIAGARTGDATLLDAMYSEAKATQDRSDRRNLMVALFAFTDPQLAQKGMGLLLDPAFDNRESWAALSRAHWEVPARRATYDYIVANYDALAKSVSPEAPGNWPEYASGLCSEQDATDLTAFWKPREKELPSAAASLAEAVESIRACAAMRAKARESGM
jgi:ERAP1-like protein